MDRILPEGALSRVLTIPTYRKSLRMRLRRFKKTGAGWTADVPPTLIKGSVSESIEAARVGEGAGSESGIVKVLAVQRRTGFSIAPLWAG